MAAARAVSIFVVTGTLIGFQLSFASRRISNSEGEVTKFSVEFVIPSDHDSLR
jgi:hypothetical protein